MIITINSIYDLISLISLFIIIYFIFTFDIILIIGAIVCISIHFIIKLVTNGWYPPIFKRPDGAKNCDLFNKGGLVENQSGFPSGHVTIVSFVIEILLLRNNNNDNILKKIYYNIPTILVGYARVGKGCHNCIQVIAGYLLGYLVANVLYKYENAIIEYIKDNMSYFFNFYINE